MADKHLSLSENEDIVGISIEDSITESQEIDPLPDDPEQLLKMLEKCQNKFELLESENGILSEKYNSVSKQLNSKKEGSKQTLLQAETMGMMTKYQLVFVKMETAFSKIFNHNKLRDLKRMQDAFAKFKYNTIKNRIEINCGSKIALENLKHTAKINKFLQTRARMNLKDAFQRWKNSNFIEKSIKKKKDELEFELENAIDEKERIKSRITVLEEEIEENGKRYEHLYSLVKDNKKKISLYENKGRELSNDINQILDQDPNTRVEIGNTSPSHSKIAALKNKLSNAMNENKELNSQLELTDDNVKSFITEMSTLISTHEISHMIDPLENNQDMFDGQYRNSGRRVQQSN